MMYSRPVLMLFVAIAALAGCRREQPAPPPPPAQATAQAPVLPPRPMADTAGAGAARAAAVVAARTVLQERIHFDYDQSAIRPDARQVLMRKLPILRASPQVQIRVEGHGDERGSNEYNLALGNRRAQAIVMFFTTQGIPAARLQMTSFGEERPLVNQSNESAWAQNRRGEFVITAGADQINPPS